MLNETKLNTLKNKLFDQLKIISPENKSLRYTKCNVPVHKDEFENTESDLGWYISWENCDKNTPNESNYEIKPLKFFKRNNSNVHKEMLRVLDEPEFPLKQLSNSVSAVLTDINNNVILSSRNLRTDDENKTIQHAEQIILSELNNINLPVKKLRLYVTLIPCIECFKKIYGNDYIFEIIYLKDYRTSLVLTQHRNWIKSINEKKKRNYLMSTESLKTPESRRVCYHHDAYLIQQRVTDILDKSWFKELNDGVNSIEISKVNYNDFEKLIIIMKYLDKNIISLADDFNGGSIKIDKAQFESKILDMKEMYKGKGKNNKLVNLLEEKDSTIKK